MDEPRLGWADRPLMARSLANPTRAALRAWVPVLCLKPTPLKRGLCGSEARRMSVSKRESASLNFCAYRYLPGGAVAFRTFLSRPRVAQFCDSTI